MPAPTFDFTASLMTTRDDLVFLRTMCLAHQLSADQAAIVQVQLAHWDAITAAQAGVTHLDNAIDADVDRFVVALKTVVDFDLEDPLYRFFVKTDVGMLKRPVLGPELATIASWLPTLATAAKKAEDPATDGTAPEAEVALRQDARLPKLAPFFAVFAAHVQSANEAVKTLAAAKKANEAFRTMGGLKQYYDKVAATRDAIFTTLDARRAANKEAKLPRNFASSVFRTRTRGPTEAQLTERNAKRAADRLAREELRQKTAEAKQRVREAKAALRALGK